MTDFTVAIALGFVSVASGLGIMQMTQRGTSRNPPLIVPIMEVAKQNPFPGTNVEIDGDPTADPNATCLNDHEILSLLLRGYNKNKLPRVLDGSQSAVAVFVEVWVQDISKISDTTQDFVLSIYVTETWRDPGLDFANKNPCKPNMTLTESYIDKVWVPNLTFINSKSAHFHKSPFLNFWLFLGSNGTLWMNYRMNLTIPCDTDLTAFPMDHRVCTVEFESYNHHNGEVSMRWQPGSRAITVLQTVTAAWKARSSEPKDAKHHDASKIDIFGFVLSSVTNKAKSKSYPAGDWDELSMVFVFKRRYGWYIIQVYVPSYLAIFTSWVTFTFGPKAIPARCMCVVNALLTLTFQFETIFRDLPRVSYVKAIDIWMMGCTMFVFAAMVELSIIGNLKGSFMYKGDQSLIDPSQKDPAPSKPPRASYLRRRRLATISELSETEYFDELYASATDSDSCASMNTTIATEMGWDEDGQPEEETIEVTSPTIYRSVTSLHLADHHICSVACSVVCCELEPFIVDKISMLLFPSCFSMFNIAYWAYYATKFQPE